MNYPLLFAIWLSLGTYTLYGQAPGDQRPTLYLHPHLTAPPQADRATPDDWLVMMDGETYFANAQDDRRSPGYQLAPIPVKAGLHHLDVYAPHGTAPDLQWSEAQPQDQAVDLEPARRDQLGGGNGQECACNQPENGQSSVASLWYQYIPATTGADLLYVSTDLGQHWYPAQLVDEEGPLRYLAPTDSTQQQFVLFSSEPLEATEPSTTTATEEPATASTPWELQLEIFPNPFESNTTLAFSLAEDDQLSIEVYTLTGQLIHREAPQAYPAGSYQIDLDTQSWAGGTYLCKLSGNQGTTSRKLICIR
ncbi:MAG: T9SS type A sorting domain-containing protein [Bacteroidota bacterium]